ncbi:hypothetical protein D8674_007495 [Pyrus ussuriensis x Pyrus communis]|uniref:Uncharacterized protein n=1 Tax=Pyrus ussuriensis x Pyrus communis TaxID=2448454 RepID=A0A5N5HQ22_9ROSA|nr:hypothetical protein D8674_007495 [Pyrus ussuriensis x Pyrus communis]
MAASSDGVSGCNLFCIGLGGFKNYKLMEHWRLRHSHLDFPNCSKFFSCVMSSFFEKSVIPPSEGKVEFAPNHEIQETWMRSIHWTNEIKKIDD